MYRHDTFLHSHIHMAWGLLPVPIHGICHKQTLTCMGHTHTLTMTTLVGPLQEIVTFAHQLLSWTCCLIPSPEGCWSHSSASATYSSGSMSSLVCPLMPTSKQWLSSVVHYTYIYIPIFLPIIQYPMHAIHILMHFKHKLRKCSYNQQDRV